MKRTAILFALALVLPAAGCGKKTTTDDGGGGTDAGGNIPPMPALGAQMDRMGRGTVNVAATNPFDLDLSALNQAAKNRDATRDAYNQDNDPSQWVAHWQKVYQKNLAIYDGVDTVCGNQLLADLTKTDATRYATLAAVLADDKLYLDTTQTACNIYLGVEANATFAAGALKDCGGRTPLESVVAETYTMLTIGPADFVATGKFKINDGVPGDVDPDPNGETLTTFPFLGEPN